MASIFNINHYQPKKKDEFLFDTNVWIYITIPGLSYDQTLPQSYANFWGLIRKSNATVLTSFVIISEFVNRYLRNELNKYNKKMIVRFLIKNLSKHLNMKMDINTLPIL